MPKGRRGKTNTTIVLAAREQRKEPTPQEKRLWEALRGRKLEGLKFRRQHPYLQFLLDNFCVEHQLVVEIDGGIHDDPDQRAHDDARTQALEEYGIRVLRFRNEEVDRDMEGVLQRIREAILTPQPPSPVTARKQRAPSQKSGG